MNRFRIAIGLCLISFTSNVSASPELPSITCEGKYGGHLQGIASDGKSIFWSHTVQLVKTDLTGRLSKRIEVPNHHGDLTYHDGRVYVAVELGEFNQPAGKSKPWVYVYSAKDLELLATQRVPELVHGSGGIAYHDGSFVVVGGLPGDHEQNYLFEYDETFRFKKRHVLPSGQTRLGIQTAGFVNGEWWFGCYGSPKNPGLLKVDRRFRLVGKEATDFSYGIVQLGRSEILRGACFDEARRGKAVRTRLAAPAEKPRVRFAAYNVLFGIWTRPEQLGAFLREYEFDVVGLGEVPGGDWTERVGRVAGLKHVYVGKISSANHKDKYKSILSRTPLTNPHEIEIQAAGWSPASAVGAETVVRGVPLLVYSTHIPGGAQANNKVEESAAVRLAQSVLAKSLVKNLVLLGDLNHLPGDAPLARIERVGFRAMWPDLKIDTARLSTHRHIESGKESGVIDHIYYRAASGARAVEGGVIHDAFNPRGEDKKMSRYRREWEEYGRPLSDHRPVWAVLEFPKMD
ncbi:MAG: endonuclease/exonuclease/phosphatase family protein [Planctomycetota bacterium]